MHDDISAAHAESRMIVSQLKGNDLCALHDCCTAKETAVYISFGVLISERIRAMCKRYKIQWRYEPTDFYKIPASVTVNSYEITFDGGVAISWVSDVREEKIKQLVVSLSKRLRSVVLSFQCQAHQRLDLVEGYSYCEIHENGSSGSVVIKPAPAILYAKGGIGAVVIRDAEGNILTDSRLDAAAAGKDFAELILSAPEDHPLVLRLLKAYENAIHEPQNELIHLYEIRDALSEKYGNTAYEILGLSEKSWNRFGKIANKLPLTQGRHRGRSKVLSKANSKVLEYMRTYAREMIVAYIKHLGGDSDEKH